MTTDQSHPEVYTSTGTLPDAGRVDAAVAQAHRQFAGVADGAVSDVYPALARVDPALFGVCLVGVDGRQSSVGDADHEFTIMSVSKPFVFALVCDLLGPQTVRDRIGVDATGLPFNSLAAVERSSDGRTNPMVNSGAIATTSLAPGDSPDARWAFLKDGLSRFAGRDLSLDEEVVGSALRTNLRNRAIASLLAARGRIYCDPDDAITLYTQQCSLAVSAKDLAVMGATLADGGVNPVTGRRVVAASVCHYALAVMATGGMYESSGQWLYEVGLPAKSGIGGGITVVSPGKGGLGVFSPPLDAYGNSVRGTLAARYLSLAAGLDLFASAPAR